MLRTVAIAAFASTMLACLPAQAQEPTLDGAPGYLARQEAARKAEAERKAEAQKKAAQQAQSKAAADKLQADQAKLAQQAEALKAEQARLEKLAEDLKAREERLDVRATELAEERTRLLQARVDEASSAAKLAARSSSGDEAATNEDLRGEGLPSDGLPGEDLPGEDFGGRLSGAAPELRQPLHARLDFDAARRSCLRVAEDRALARNFYSAHYDAMPRFYQNDGWELRGRMRLEDRRGYLLIDTVCEIDASSEARTFIFLR